MLDSSFIDLLARIVDVGAVCLSFKDMNNEGVAIY